MAKCDSQKNLDSLTFDWANRRVESSKIHLMSFAALFVTQNQQKRSFVNQHTTDNQTADFILVVLGVYVHA